ncbi:ASPIC/UnbV domain-containing protein, partial [Mariniblastus sp.]|nr:ASPIC/UnbV domain-containing protein [Mariniblastus sp.]
MFRDSEFILGVEPRAGGITAPWFELDTSNTTDNALVLETIQKFSPPPKLPKLAVVWSALGTRSSVLFDLENDGDLDIVTLEMNHYPMVLVSDLSEKKQDMTFIKVKLVGTKSNRSAFGAVVNVDVDGKKLMKVKDGQSGYMSHSDFPLYFGLDSAKQVSQIRVDWPSGKQQIVEGPLDVNRLIVITEEE